MLKTLTATTNDLSPLVIRLVLGLVMLPHGLQKTFGWFGGGGWDGTMGFFTGQLGVPAIVAAFIILGESLGALGLITGTLTRVAAFGLGVIQIGAVFVAHLPHGFFMNWYGTQAGEGYEYGLLAIAMSVSLLITGAGTLSVDRAVAAR